MLEGRTIVISGASSGIGREIAIYLSSLKARCVLVGRDQTRLEETQQRCVSDSLIVACDFTDYSRFDAHLEMVETQFGKIHGYVHSAGVEQTKLLPQVQVEDLRNMFEINLFSGIEFSKRILKKRYRGDSISIVFISSIMGVVGNKGLTAYSATKGAVIAAVKSMALEVADKGARINAVSPGHIADSAMSMAKEGALSEEARQRIADSHPLGLGTCQDVAEMVAFLLSQRSKWVTGQNFVVDGGYTIQ